MNHQPIIDPTQPTARPQFHKSEPLDGQTFGKLTVLEFAGRNKHAVLIWRCRCECGNTRLAYGWKLVKGMTVSCGCIGERKTSDRSRTHGMTETITYKSWRSMLSRCERSRDISYSRYGGRGITVCDRWHNFENFLADMGERPSKAYQIERDDNEGNYTPDNCRWATRKEQARNRRSNRCLTCNGKTMTIAEWCEETGMTRSQIANRITLGWPDEQILTRPVRPRRKRDQSGQLT